MHQHQEIWISILKTIQVPYTEKTADRRLEQLENALDDKWLENDAVLDHQMGIVLKILNLGAYSIPAKVLESKKLAIHLTDVLNKELIKCLKEIRQGNNQISNFDASKTFKA